MMRAGVVLAVLFAGLATVAVERVPDNFEIRMLTPGWMPQQLARLVEFANDVQVSLIADRRPAEHSRVALVLIRQGTLEELPYLSPIDRGLLARLVTAVDSLGAGIIALDIVLDAPTEPEKDKQLEAALKAARATVVLGAIDERVELSERRRAWQSEFLARAGHPSGFFNLRYDAQESSGNPIIRYRAGAAPGSHFPQSFAEAVAKAARQAPAGSSRRIAWLGAPLNGGETFLKMDAEAVLAAARDPGGVLALALGRQLAGKVVLVGADLPDRDRHPTPLTLFEEAGMAGVEVHAHVVAALLDGRRLDDVGWPLRPALMFIGASLGFLIGWFAGHRRWVVTIATATGLGMIGAIVAAVLWHSRAIVPVAGIAALFLAGTFAGRFVRRYAAGGRADGRGARSGAINEGMSR